MKKSVQFEIQKLHVITNIKCLILDILENFEILNYIWRKRQKFHILLLLGVDIHKKTKTTLGDLFQKLHEKETISKMIQIIINSYCFPNFEWIIIYPKQFRCSTFMNLLILHVVDDGLWPLLVLENMVQETRFLIPEFMGKRI